jgi:two-component system, LytTR family, sensor histidine kinase AgrC
MKQRLNISKAIITVIILNVVQIAAILAVLLYTFLINRQSPLDPGYYGVAFFVLVIVFSIILNSIIAIRDRYILQRTDFQSQLLKDTLSQAENLNHTLRAQRHDFMNHLQVVYSLMEMDEYKDAKDYIERVYTDIQKVSRILKTSHTAINALLQAKVLDCEKHDIRFGLHVTSQLKDLKIPSWELCRILANLMDNAIFALEKHNGVRTLDIDIYEDLKYHGFRVKDNGPAIPSHQLDRIFEPGFTTKGEKGSGMGLAITRDIVREHSGKISVQSSEAETVFEVLIPR